MSGVSRDMSRLIIQQMSDAIIHRGPDSAGHWIDEQAGVGMGHRRLAIIDLSPEGHQPMISACGRYVIVFNGEIYNYRSLRQQIERQAEEGAPPRFRGRSDTEVMLACISRWGLSRALQSFNGMFAFALWDRLERQLHLARDRIGEKPLYYGWLGSSFVFGSELKALRKHPHFRNAINRDALTLYLRYGYVPSPYSIYEGIHKLPPATMLTVRTGGTAADSSPRSYWSCREAAERGVAAPFEGSEGEAIEELDTLLRDSVKIRMEADVPLGAFLSGGIDSSTVVALMQNQSNRAVKTFSIGFHVQNYNEAEHARAVAEHLGTEHTELYVTPQQALSVLDRMTTLFDEPFADPSQIPTFLVSELARRHVTVSLSGDGGDELFAGYPRYFGSMKYWRKLRPIPFRVRQLAAGALSSVPVAAWDNVFGMFSGILPSRVKKYARGDRVYEAADVLKCRSPDALYGWVISRWKTPTKLVRDGREPPTALCNTEEWAGLPDFVSRMEYYDCVTYLPDDIMVKLDRASMGVSLEARVPILDHRVVEFSWRLPLSMKIKRYNGKWLLRQVLYKYVPKNLVDRPKMGFAVPIDSWLRGELREWCEDLLNEKRLCEGGFLNPRPIRKAWAEHLSGVRNWHDQLWVVLSLQAWLAAQ